MAGWTVDGRLDGRPFRGRPFRGRPFRGRARARIPCSTVHTRTAVARSTAVLLVLDLVLVPVFTARTMQKSAYL